MHKKNEEENARFLELADFSEKCKKLFGTLPKHSYNRSFYLKGIKEILKNDSVEYKKASDAHLEYIQEKENIRKAAKLIGKEKKILSYKYEECIFHIFYVYNAKSEETIIEGIKQYMHIDRDAAAEIYKIWSNEKFIIGITYKNQKMVILGSVFQIPFEDFGEKISSRDTWLIKNGKELS